MVSSAPFTDFVNIRLHSCIYTVLEPGDAICDDISAPTFDKPKWAIAASGDRIYRR